jgi:hypothetical protein
MDDACAWLLAAVRRLQPGKRVPQWAKAEGT